MQRRFIINAILLMSLITSFAAPAVAQTPTPQTPLTLLEVGRTDPALLPFSKVPSLGATTALSTTPQSAESPVSGPLGSFAPPAPSWQARSSSSDVEGYKGVAQISYAVADSWQCPLNSCSNISFGFGPPNWSSRYHGYHLADDITAEIGDPVYAAANGKKVGPTIPGYGGYGSAILIEHTLPDGSRVVSLYGHITPISIDEVSKGQLIGTVAWDHLHYGIRKGAYQASASCPGWASTNWPYSGYTMCVKCTSFHDCSACAPSDAICPDYHYNLWWSPVQFILANGSSGSTCTAPAISSPASGFVSPGDTLTFVWTHPGNCNGQNGYILRVGTSSGGSDVVSSHTSLGLQTNYTFSSQWYNRDLYWSVRANASLASWSESRRFRIEPNQGGGCSGCSSYVTNFSFNPDSPSSATSVIINVNINTSFPNFRAARVRVLNGESLGESSSFNQPPRTWDTRNTPDGDQCVVLEIDDTIGTSWDNPATCYHPYHLNPRPTPPPPTPSLVSPANGASLSYNSTVILDWLQSTGATEYLARLRDDSSYLVYSNWIPGTEWTVGQLWPGTFYWQVQAHNQYGYSSYSSERSFTIQQGVPNAPSSLNASAVTQSQINLTWTDNSSNESGFRLFREGLLAATLGAGTTSYQDSSLECGRGYNYYVVAYNSAGQSAHSNTASATTQACPPTAPPAPNPISPSNGATFICGNTINLGWNNIGTGVEYYIETWGANSSIYSWQTGNTLYLGQQLSGSTQWHVKARYVGETVESAWGTNFLFNVASCPQFPDLRPYADPGWPYPVIPSMVEGTHTVSTLFIDEPTYFDWHFINEGTAYAPGTFYVELWVDDYRVLRYPQPDIAIGQVGGWDDWAHTVTAPGRHLVRLVTDPDEVVPESNETNNEWNRLFYWHVPCGDPRENNDDPSRFSIAYVGQTVTGVDVCPYGDYDYYGFLGYSGSTIVADIDAQTIGSKLDSVLTLLDSDGITVLAENDDFDGLDSRIRYTISTTDAYLLRVRDYGNNDGGGDHYYQLSLSAGDSAPYFNDFETNATEWQTQGLWHPVDQSSPFLETYSGAHSWWYGQDSTGTYETVSTNSGSLTSPAVYIPAEGYYLRFNTWYQTETSGLNYDRRCVQISVDGGPYTTIYCLSDDGMGWWHNSPALDLSAYIDHIIRVRFHFDTVDMYNNDFRGWYIDDVDISNTPPPSCADNTEPNDTPATATTIAYGDTKVGRICPGGDRDFFTFTGTAGDTIIADVDAQVFYAAELDSVLTLLASDGVTELASNDDAAGSTDSLLGYTLPESGVYYLKVRDYRHPSSGGIFHFYELSLYVDDSPPTGVFLTPTSNNYITSTGNIPIVAEVSDTESGVRNVVFLWHSGDWSDPNWEVLGDDWDGSDGWSIDWNVESLPDQSDAALYAWVFDWGGNWVGMECWGLTLDRESPVSAVETYPTYDGASSRDFWLSWYGEDATSGIATYDIQYRIGTEGTWTDFITETTGLSARVVGADGYTYFFRSRARDYAGNAGLYPSMPESFYTVQVCSIAPDIWESDNIVADAKVIQVNAVAQAHNFHSEGDQDWGKFTATQGQSYKIETSNLGGYADTVLYLYDSDGATLLDFNDDTEELGWGSRITWTAPATGVYYVRVLHWDYYAYGCSTSYTIVIHQDRKIFLPMVLR